MPREHYRNGDKINLTHCGCDGCNMMAIQGVLCHETGCEFVWKDTLVECQECGREFYPSSGRVRVCPGCIESWNDFEYGDYDDDERECDDVNDDDESNDEEE